MTDHSHAHHRPPVGQDPAQVSPPTSFGQLYPTDDVLAVMDDRAAAERAAGALREAGIPEDDYDVLDGAWVTEVMRTMEQGRGLLGRIAAAVAADDASYLQEFAKEAQQGRAILVVHAAEPDVRERVREVLAAHGARRMRHYGRWVITDL